MRLLDLVETSRAMSATRSRNAKVAGMATLLASATPEEVEIAVAFLSGATRQGRLGVGWAQLSSAKDVVPGAHPALTLGDVDAAFARIAATSGPGSTAMRVETLRGLFGRATASEQDFLARLVMGELRQGALEGLVIDAVARAAALPPDVVRRAAMLTGDPAKVARVGLTEGAPALARLGIEVFRPIQPMLADTADSAAGALAALGDAALEYKLDGARIQVHRDGDDVRVYSRALNDVTAAVPEIVDLVRALPVRRLVLDGEVIALRPDGTPHPFQVTMRRFGRRLDVTALRAELPVQGFLFDALLVDDDVLVDAPQRERFAALCDVVPDAAGAMTTTAGTAALAGASRLLTVPHLVTMSPDEADAFMQRALAAGHEGLVAKARQSSYAAGSRGAAWLKVKQAQTLDLVVLAAEWGNGRRQGWLSNLHLGARDPERGGFVMLGKTFKGLTDAMLTWQTERLLALEMGRDGHVVHVRPELVVEIAFNDLQVSPQYPGGLALRFARVKRYRTDKTAAEADTIAAVQDIYRRMTGNTPPPRR
jgi:DNA ligase-1